MGTFATTQDLVLAKSLLLQKENQQGAGISRDMIAALKNETAATSDWSRVNQQSQIGVFDLGAATKATGEQLKSWIDHKYLDPNDPEQYAAAMQTVANRLRGLSEAAKVAGSNLPQMTQLGLDAGNMFKQIDTFGVSSMTPMTVGLVDIELGGSA
jgi:DNA-binding phage protein